MEKFTLAGDITVMYVTASSFPDGVLAAHQELHRLVSTENGRRFFGLSRPENGGDILYKAAAEELYTGESKQNGLETMVIKKGDYCSITVTDFMSDPGAIGKAFNTILHSGQPIDPHGYCVEWYLNDEQVQCMVRLQPAER